MSFNYSPNIVTDSLVLYLDGANTRSYPRSGTTWNDLSRSNYTGTLINGPTFDSTNGGSILFDGSNDLVEITNSTALTSFTISIWFKMTGPGSTGGVSNTIYNNLFGINSGQRRILVATSANTGIEEGRILVQMGGSNYFSSVSTATVTNRWNNVVYTWQANTATIYINGIAETPQTNSSVTFPAANLFLGAYSNPIVAYAMKGNIAQTSIYNRVLSATQILKNYNALKSRFGL
jgi:hypothetical protein